jgi:hypothetical protein
MSVTVCSAVGLRHLCGCRQHLEYRLRDSEILCWDILLTCLDCSVFRMKAPRCFETSVTSQPKKKRNISEDLSHPTLNLLILSKRPNLPSNVERHPATEVQLLIRSLERKQFALPRLRGRCQKWGKCVDVLGDCASVVCTDASAQ